MLFSKVSVLKYSDGSFIFKRLISKQVRVRFAPSPTGLLHLGGLRTALYNHLFAKSQNGTTILRIEDTDLSRRIPSAAEDLIEDLAWCGITYDEGPYFQSERKEIYLKYAKQLVDQGDAYYCFCSETRLNLVKREALKAGEVPKYDNHCRYLSKDEFENSLKKNSYCIRFKLSSFKDSYTDLVFGTKFHDVCSVEGDPVILKSDGFPTYHLANVVDDHLMNITHVLRGVEWLTSTTKHLLLYRAFKWNPPQFGHLPLLMNTDGTKLSKRQASVQVRQLRSQGYFANSLINFVIRLGGGFDIKTTEEFKMYVFDELIDKFDLTKIKSSSCQADLKSLTAYNNAEILRLFETVDGKQALVKEVQELVRDHFQNSKYENSLLLNDEHVEFILKTMKNRISSLKELVTEDFHYLWIWESNWNEEYEIHSDFIKKLVAELETVNWNGTELQEFLKRFCNQYPDYKYSDLMKIIRFALISKKSGPGIAEIMTMLSKEVVLYRLSKVVERKSSSTLNKN